MPEDGDFIKKRGHLPHSSESWASRNTMPDSVQLLEEVYADLYTHIKWKRGCVGIHGGGGAGKGGRTANCPCSPLRRALPP